MKISLVIMAAGIGSRFGGGIKQLESVGPNGEIIMDYSIHDAIAAGFERIVFVIRRDVEAAFRAVIGHRVEALCARRGVEVAYVYQELDNLPAGVVLPEGRTKPWGTCHAVLCCRDAVDGPFGVINADDYYGKDAYKKLFAYLSSPAAAKDEFAMVAYPLASTLSKHGAVIRGVCRTDEAGYLTAMEEMPGIMWVDGQIRAHDGSVLQPKERISMNMWGFTPAIFPVLEEAFRRFAVRPGDDRLTRELVLPAFMGQLLQKQQVRIKMLTTDGLWLGVTYKEDVARVRSELIRLTAAGEYSSPLFGDM